MLCECYDGIFDQSFLVHLDNTIKNIPMETSNMANVEITEHRGIVGKHRLFGACLFRRDGINRVLRLHEKAELFFDIFDEIQKFLNRKYFLTGIDMNLQHSGCDGFPHIDGQSPKEKTIMLMSNCYWEKEWGGQFQLTNEDGTDIIEEYEYVPGRVLVIPSNHLHRGLGPKLEYPYEYRTTVVFRTEPLKF
jgi:hypothetical protein